MINCPLGSQECAKVPSWELKHTLKCPSFSPLPFKKSVHAIDETLIWYSNPAYAALWIFHTRPLNIQCWLSPNCSSGSYLNTVLQTSLKEFSKGWMHARKDVLHACVIGCWCWSHVHFPARGPSVRECVYVCICCAFGMIAPNVSQKQSVRFNCQQTPGTRWQFVLSAHKQHAHTHTHTHIWIQIHSKYYVHRHTTTQNIPVNLHSPFSAHHSHTKSSLTPKSNQKAFTTPSSHCTDVLYLSFIYSCSSLHLCFAIIPAVYPHIVLASVV